MDRPSIPIVLLAVLLLTVPGLAQEPPWPDPPEGTFQIPGLRVGDAGIYTITSAEDTGLGFREMGATRDLLRFEWLEDRWVPTARAREAQVHVVRMMHDGWASSYEPRTTVDEVFVAMDGGSSVGMHQPDMGGYAGKLDRTYVGGWGDKPCLIRSPVVAGLDLAKDDLTVQNCRIRGESLYGTYDAVIRTDLGPYDSTVFHRGRNGAGQGEAWIWLAKGIPVPVAIVVQEAQRPMRFDVVRLTHFRAGDDLLVWGSDEEVQPWGPLDRAPWGRFVPDEPGWVAFPVQEAMDAALAHPDGAPLQDWLDAHPGAFLSDVDGGTTSSGSSGRTITHHMTFMANGTRADVSVTRRWHGPIDGLDPLPVPLPRPANETLEELEDSVDVRVHACDCEEMPDWVLEAAVPTIAAAGERWQAVRSDDADGLQPTTWSFSRKCVYLGCELLDFTLEGGHDRIASNRNADGSMTEVVEHSMLSLRDDLRAGGPPGVPSMVLEELMYPEEDPADEKEAVLPPFEATEDALGILEHLVAKGVLHHPAAPSQDADAGDPPLPETGVQGVAVRRGPISDGPGSAAVAGAATALVALVALSWIAIAKGLFGALFSRISAHRILDHPLRAQIHGLIEARPGIHFSGIATKLGRQPGVVRHHLDRLVRAGMVEEARSHGATAYFLRGRVDRRVQRASPALASPMTRKVLASVARAPGIGPKAVAQGLGVTPATITHHLRRLKDAGLLEVRRSGRRALLTPTALGISALAVRRTSR